MAQILIPVSKAIAGTPTATFATALTNYNTAIAAAITAAQAVSGVQTGSIQVSGFSLIFDATNYICSAQISYNTIVSS